jgi:hypothetical protein
VLDLVLVSPKFTRLIDVGTDVRLSSLEIVEAEKCFFIPMELFFSEFEIV